MSSVLGVLEAEDPRESYRSLFCEAASSYWIVDRVAGRVVQVYQIFWSHDTRRWAVFAQMPQQVTRAWWNGHGDVS